MDNIISDTAAVLYRRLRENMSRVVVLLLTECISAIV